MNYTLKFALLKSGEKQITVARKAKVSESKFSKIINGHINPTLEEKQRIAKILNKPVLEIFSGDENFNESNY